MNGAPGVGVVQAWRGWLGMWDVLWALDSTGSFAALRMTA
jgi:hypothetical protein